MQRDNSINSDQLILIDSTIDPKLCLTSSMQNWVDILEAKSLKKNMKC